MSENAAESDALARVEALCSEWEAAAQKPMPKRAETESAQDQGVRIGVWHSVQTAARELRKAIDGIPRCPSMPPGMHPVMQTLAGAQYHRCRHDVGHEPPHANAEGFTWTRHTSPEVTP